MHPGAVPPPYRRARWFLVLVSVLVPTPRREEWLEEWSAELWQLLRRGERGGRGGGVVVAVAGYLAGAPWSALLELREEWMRNVWQDVRYGARSPVRSPAFLGVGVLTLALGIGANTTVFSLVNGLLLRDPTGITAPTDLVRIGRGHAPTFDNWSHPVYRDFRDRADWFSGVAGYAMAGTVILGTGVDAEAVHTQLVSDNYFDVLGVRPHLGRDFMPEETASPGAGPVVVISHDLWLRRLSGRDDVVGSVITVNGRALEVVGVAPEGFTGSEVLRAVTDLWLPTSMIDLTFGPGAASMLDRRGSSWFWVFARLAPGVTLEQATAAEPDWDAPSRVIGVVSDFRNRTLQDRPWAQYWIPFDRNYRGAMKLVARTHGDPAPLARDLAALIERLDPGMPVLRAAPLRDLVGGTLGETRMVSTLIAIFGSIALLLAAIGLYGVMAYGVAQRTRELGIRIAIGASQHDIRRLVLGQGLRVAAAGLGAGLILAIAGLRVLRGMLFDVQPRIRSRSSPPRRSSWPLP